MPNYNLNGQDLYTVEEGSPNRQKAILIPVTGPAVNLVKPNTNYTNISAAVAFDNLDSEFVNYGPADKPAWTKADKVTVGAKSLVDVTLTVPITAPAQPAGTHSYQLAILKDGAANETYGPVVNVAAGANTNLTATLDHGAHYQFRVWSLSDSTIPQPPTPSATVWCAASNL